MERENPRELIEALGKMSTDGGKMGSTRGTPPPLQEEVAPENLPHDLQEK